MNNNWLSFSPHIRAHTSVNKIYLLFIIAIIPAVCGGIIRFGFNAALILMSSTLTALLLDLIISIIKNKKFVLYDVSSVYVGLLVGLTIPPNVSLFVPIVASAFIILLVKALCGGTGQNFVSEVAAGKILAALMFGSGFMKFIRPQTTIKSSVNIVEGVIAGRDFNFNLLDVLFDGVYGGIGETAILWLVIGGVFLCAAKVIDYKIPLVYLAITMGIGSAIFGVMDALILVSGSGAVLVAFFVLTDYASSPKNFWHSIIFAASAGFITILIWKFGQNPILAAYYSCLIVNLVYAAIKGICLSDSRRAA